MEYQDKVSPSIDVKFMVSDEKDLQSRIGSKVIKASVVIWTTTTLDVARE